MRICSEGLSIIKEFEGWSRRPYRDPIGIPTIGYGSIWGLDRKRLTMAHREITQDEGEIMLTRMLQHAERAVARLIKTPLTSSEFSALVSFTYNLGAGNLQRSTLRMKANRGDKIGAADEFPKWRRAGGRILAGLVRRRKAEQALWLN
ncbi:MAG: lysozyme [Rhodospirillaceae bacterium]|jgi:lysozyme|nr:lysozyme [Rhodospirillaceae bacterium]MBT4045460.1 lysozyme [Rhodospirillaceae bacterium]MBT4690445.1 lysozyme [Rhodospirillaceae bacterium]MBT5083163.1 lysozyme [Rhodospirillaceae bacterium]MBT5526466.1 lysozyme [Rhodospirillaceae bacterium]